MSRTNSQRNRMSADALCRQSATAVQRVDRNTCRNNCAEYDRQNKICKIGYNFKPKR